MSAQTQANFRCRKFSPSHPGLSFLHFFAVDVSLHPSLSATFIGSGYGESIEDYEIREGKRKVVSGTEGRGGVTSDLLQVMKLGATVYSWDLLLYYCVECVRVVVFDALLRFIVNFLSS